MKRAKHPLSGEPQYLFPSEISEFMKRNGISYIKIRDLERWRRVRRVGEEFVVTWDSLEWPLSKEAAEKYLKMKEDWNFLSANIPKRPSGRP